MIYTFKKITVSILVSFVYILFAGCSVKSPNYQADSNLANKLNNYDLNSVNIEKSYNINLVNSDKLALRGANLISYYGQNFQDYLEESLKKQLSQNDLYLADSEITIKSELLINNVDIWGFSEGYYNISAKFTIYKNGKIVYDTTKSIMHTFPSHFIGQIAITNGINNYPIAIQKLISALLSDREVISIMQK